MSRRGENIYKRKDGRWEGRFLFSYDGSGKAKYKYIYDKSYTEVKEKLRDLHTLYNTEPLLANQKIHSKTFEYWAEKWLLSKKNDIKLSTYVLYRNYVYNHILPTFNAYPINKISTEFLENFLHNLLLTGRTDNKGGLSSKTASDILIVLKEIFKFAKYHDASIICNLEKISVKKQSSEMRVLSHSEQERLIQLLTEDTDLYKLGFLLSLSTGIRIGELCALRWKNICLEDKTIKIEHTMQRIQNDDQLSPQKTKVIITAPKSYDSVRVIPLPEFMINLLKPFKSNPTAFLLSGKCQTYVEPRTMQNKFKKYTEKSKIENATCHCLRHTFCTNCIEVGFDIKTLSEIMGHSSVRITLDKYAHSSLKLKRENMAKLKLY